MAATRPPRVLVAWHDGGVLVRRCARSALALVAALLAVGCEAAPAPVASGSTPPSAAVPAAARGVRMEIVQLRGDVASGHLELRVTNESDAALTVVRATYESSRWAEPMVREDEAQIPSGLRRNLRLELPEPTCDAAPVEHRATLELSDGTVLEAEPEDPLGQLERLDAPACDLQRFEEQIAALSWLPPRIPADGGGPAVLRLEVAPVEQPGAQRGTLETVTATTLLTPVDASGERLELLPLDLPIARGDGTTVVEVPLEPGRCDLHAIAEDKQGTIFRVLGELDGAPIELVLVSPRAQREALLDWVVARCGTGG